MWASLELIDLLALPDTAKNRPGSQVEVASVSLKALANLNRKLTRRRQDKCKWPFENGLARLTSKPIENGKSKCSFFPGASSRYSKYVSNFKG